MTAAIEQAKQALLCDEIPIGSVIAIDDQIISFGSNKCISKNSPVRHAEIEAIESACNNLQNYRLPGASIYVTVEPCHMCCMAIVNARIKNLYFGAREPKTGAVISVDRFLDKDFLNHKVNYSGGHLEDQTKNLLKNFFVSRRKVKLP